MVLDDGDEIGEDLLISSFAIRVIQPGSVHDVHFSESFECHFCGYSFCSLVSLECLPSFEIFCSASSVEQLFDQCVPCRTFSASNFAKDYHLRFGVALILFELNGNGKFVNGFKKLNETIKEGLTVFMMCVVNFTDCLLKWS